VSLSSELISQFVKATKDTNKNKPETTVYGTIVYDGKPYVKLDGSDLLTPVSTTADVKDGERVTVMIKNHTATVTGNMSSPAARKQSVDDVADQITEVEILVADKVSTKDFDAERGRIDELVSDNVTIRQTLTANKAEIDNLTAENVTITEKVTANEAAIKNLDTVKLSADIADIKYAKVGDLEATNAIVHNLDTTYAKIDSLEAISASVNKLDVEKLSAEDAKIKYADIDFSNIGETAIRNLYATSGVIENIVISDGTITGNLVGVTIKGDLIEGNTIVADKLVVRGEDGLYYKLNFEAGSFTDTEEVPTDSLHGSVITAKSITATKISVDDLVAFDATIGGFNIGTDSLYSGVKASIDNTTRGIYMGVDGQVSFGDSNNYVRYYKVTDSDGNETYKLEISAESILFGDGSKSSAADLKALTEHVKIGTYIDPDTGDEKPSVELAEGDSDFKQVITNTKTMFMDGSAINTEINTNGVETENVTVKKELKQGNWVWVQRENGNYGVIWRSDI
jgi:hypothetical protein